MKHNRATNFFRRALLLAGALISLATPVAEARKAHVDDPVFSGVNLSGGEINIKALPGRYGYDYIYPTAKEYDYFQSKGLKLIRIPFRWERIQRVLMSPLKTSELDFLKKSIALAKARGMSVVLDLHSYGRYGNKIVGSPEVPFEAFTDLWRRLATEFKDDDTIFAYGLMNEPNNMQGLWPAGAQAGMDGVRSVDMKTMVLICGDHWSNAHRWREFNENLDVKDPAANHRYEAHTYFDDTNGGIYDQTYEGEGAYPNFGVDRMRPFVTWLQDKGKKGFLGEFGVPADDPRYLEILDRTLAYAHDHCIPTTYWAGGPWTKGYRLTVQPGDDGVDRPQMATLIKHATNDSCGQSAQLVVRAKSDLLAGVGAQYEIFVNGTRIATGRTDSKIYQDLKFSLNLPASQIKSVYVRFLNDKSSTTEDRNLYVEHIRIGSTIYPSTGPNVMFHVKTLNGTDVRRGVIKINKNGYLVFSF